MTPTDNATPEALVRTYKEIKAEYAFNPDIMVEEDDRARRVKWIIDNRLSQVDKTIFLLYADLQSYRKLGKRMRISHVTCGREVLRIKEIIFRELRKMTEIWSDVPGFEGLYKINNYGEVKSLYTGKIIQQDKRGKAPVVRLWKDGARYTVKLTK